MFGKVCACSLGRIGVVVGFGRVPWGETYIGMGLDGKGLWFSRKPIVIADSLEEYTKRHIEVANARAEEDDEHVLQLLETHDEVVEEIMEALEGV